jgi:predicted nuclease of predicted toxin-antitoxin system
MKLIADEGLDKPIVDVLRNAGFDVLYVLETNQGANDELILAIANSEHRILLTQDKDFGELVFRL